MRIVSRFLIFLSAYILCGTLSFGSAISAGFNTTTDGPNDDGTYTTGGCTNPFDGGTCAGTPAPIGFNVNYYGSNYSSLYVNTNGNVDFLQPFPSVSGILTDPSGLGLLNSFDPIIAPFFANVDTRGTGTVSFGSGTFNGNQAFGVNWNNVGYFASETDKTDNFQMLLVNQGSGNFELVFNYGSMQWETSDSEFGTDGLGGYSAIAGFTDGSGNPDNTVQLPGSLSPGSFIDGGPNALVSNSLNSNIAGQYIFNFVNGAPVAATPEPDTLGLLMFALAGLLWFSHRRKPASADPQTR